MAAPTAAQVREWSQIDFGALGYPEADPDPLQVLVDRSTEYVEWATGRDFDAMPAEFDDMGNQAVQISTEMAAYQSQEDIVETAADFMLISSFSAGNYSETRRSLTELKASGMISANPILHGLLWAMLTDEQRDEWQSWLTGVNAPAFEVTEVNWGGWQGESALQGYG